MAEQKQREYPWAYRAIRVDAGDKEALRLCTKIDIILKPYTDMVCCAWQRTDTREWLVAVIGYGGQAIWDVVKQELRGHAQMQVRQEELAKVLDQVKKNNMALAAGKKPEDLVSEQMEKINPGLTQEVLATYAGFDSSAVQSYSNNDPTGITLDLRTDAEKQSGHGYTVSLDHEHGVQLGEVGEKKLAAQKPGQPFVAYYQDMLWQRKAESLLETADLLQYRGVRPEHLEEYVDCMIKVDIRQIKRAEMYQFTPTAVNLLDTVSETNPVDWIARTKPIWIELQEPIPVYPTPESPKVKAIWVRTLNNVQIFQDVAGKLQNNPLIGCLFTAETIEAQAHRWQVTLYEEYAQEVASYEHSDHEKPDAWSSTSSNSCPLNQCQPDNPCVVCQAMRSYWCQWLHTAQRIIAREYGVGPLEQEEKPMPVVTESWEEEAMVMVGKGKNKHRIKKPVSKSVEYKVVTFDATALPTRKMHDAHEPEHTGNWITDVKENNPAALVWEKRRFPGSTRVLDPERTPRWSKGGGRREVTVQPYEKKIYLLDPEYKSQTIKRVTARHFKPAEE